MLLQLCPLIGNAMGPESGRRAQFSTNFFSQFSLFLSSAIHKFPSILLPFFLLRIIIFILLFTPLAFNEFLHVRPAHFPCAFRTILGFRPMNAFLPIRLLPSCGHPPAPQFFSKPSDLALSIHHFCLPPPPLLLLPPVASFLLRPLPPPPFHPPLLLPPLPLLPVFFFSTVLPHSIPICRPTEKTPHFFPIPFGFNNSSRLLK